MEVEVGPSSVLAVEQACRQLESLVLVEKERLRYTLKRVEDHFNSEFRSLSESVQDQISNLRAGKVECTPQLLNQLSLPFSDHTRRIREKLNNTLESKQILMNTQMELTKTAELTPEQTARAKENFSLICDYTKRRESNIAGRDLYTEQVCKHLIKRTFKKTASDVYEVLASHQLPFGSDTHRKLRIACIAGGPGSDLTGALTHLVELGFRSFECVVFDFNFKTWQACSNSLAKLFSNECKKQKKPIDLAVSWAFMDITSEESMASVAAFQPDLITCCWALNEAQFNKHPWKIVLQRSKATIVVIDGDRFPIEHLTQVCREVNRKYTFCGLQNPRTLITFP